MKLIRQIFVSLFALLAVACGNSQQQSAASAENGQLTINAISGALSSRADVAKVNLTLTNTATSVVLQGAMSNSLPDNSGRWSIFFDRIPVGTYSISAQALDANNVVLFETPAPLPTASVAARSTTNVTLLLQEKTPPNPFANSAPYITTLIISQQQIDPQTTITLSVAATDPDLGDALSYAWSSDVGGTFSAASAAQTTWLPAAAGDAVITISVSDGNGAKVSTSVTINVTTAASRGAIATVVDLNNFPEMKSVTSTNAQVVVAGQIPLSALAIDKDSDPVAFAWTADCAGTYSSATGTSTSGVQGTTNVTSFTPTAQGTCKLTVTVSDGRGGTNVGSLTVKVSAVIVAEGPQFSLEPQGATDLNPTDAVEIKVVPNDGLTHAWTYAWSDGLAGAQAGAFTVAAPNDQTYHPASCAALGAGDHQITITVIATDPSTTASNAGTLGLVLHCP